VRWTDYWIDINNVIEFKRGVYGMALKELARYLPPLNHAEGNNTNKRLATTAGSK